MRRYDEEIEVRTGLIGTQEGPAHFSWRRRIWRVSQVQTRWLETADWWRSAQVEAARGDGPEVADAGDLLGEEEIWRVVASPGAAARSGVYELAHSWGRRPLAAAGGDGLMGPSSRSVSAEDDGLDLARAALVGAELADTPARALPAGPARRPAGGRDDPCRPGARRVGGTAAQRLAGGRRGGPGVLGVGGVLRGHPGQARGRRCGAIAIVTVREADDLLRDAQAFHDAVARRLARPARAARRTG